MSTRALAAQKIDNPRNLVNLPRAAAVTGR
jgi:hypothetical protein